MAGIHEEARIPVYINDEQAKSALKNLTTQADKWRAAMRKAMAEGDPKGVKEAERELKKTNKQIAELKKGAFDVDKVLDNLSSASVTDMRKALTKLKREQNQLNRETAEYAAYDKKINAIRQEFKKMSGEVTKQQGAWGKLKGSIGGFLPALGWGAAIAGAVSLTKNVYKLFDATVEARRELSKLTGQTGEELADSTARVQAIADTFEKDFREVSVAANSYAQTMGISFDEALDKIEKGFLTGADANDEFLDKLKEYGPQFKAAGVSADDAIALMSQEVKSGIYSDKGIDTIKEGTLRLREMPKATRDALEAIGISSEQMQRDLRDGNITVFQAIQQVSSKLAELPPQSSEVGQAIADIFGGPGEDAGLEFITMLGEAQGGLDAMVESADENVKVQQQMLEANKALRKAWSDLMGTGTSSFDSIWASVKMLLADGIIQLIDTGKSVRAWFTDIYNNSAVFRGVIQNTILQFKNLWEAVKAVGKTIGNVFTTGGKLISALFKGEFSKIDDIWREGVRGWADTWIDFGKKSVDNFKKGWQETVSGQLPLPETEDPEAKGSEAGEKFKKGYQSKSPVDVTVVETHIKKTAKQEDGKVNEYSPEDISVPEFKEKEEEIEDDYLVEKFEKSLEGRKILNQKYYEDGKISEQEYQDELININEQAYNERRAILDKEKQDQLNRARAYGQASDAIVQLFGEETAIGKAALVAKQAMAAAEIGIELGLFNAKTQLNTAEATQAIAVGQANTAKVGFPWNIPLIIGFLAQVAGIIQTIKSSKNTAKKVKQRRSGNLMDVIGEEDGKLYENVPLKKTLNTGLIKSPTLVAEEPEIVVDTKRTDKIRRMNPAILQAIMQPEKYVVRQRANGNLPDETADPYRRATARLNEIPAQPAYDPELKQTLNNLTQALDNMQRNGLAAYIDLYGEKGFKEGIDKVNNFNNLIGE